MRSPRALRALSPLLLMPLLPLAAHAQPRPAAPPQAQPQTQPQAPNKTRHVVMMVWDGLRPDSVSAQNTPNLFAMAARGVTFARHHCVYPSSTEVNGTALSTGAYPARSGVMGNKEYRPAINPLKAIGTEELEAIRLGDATAPYLNVPTIAEILQRAGYRTAVAGTKPVTLLANRADKDAATPEMLPMARASADIFEGKATGAADLDAVVQAQGAFPPTIEFPNTRQDTWTTQALTQVLWKTDVPAFSMLWLSDVDYTQHDSAPGSPASLAALKSCDDRLASVLGALEARGVRDSTTVFVVSDHGFSTISRNVDIYDALQKAGFQAPKKFTQAPKKGEIMVVGLGGSALFYVGEHDEAVTRRLVEFLRGTDFAGVLMSRDGLPGTFKLSQAHIDTPGAPDLAMSFRWSAAPNAFGVAGAVVSEGKRVAGQGSHATLSGFDMHNTLIAQGPDFKAGLINQTPSGNTDLAPTILSLLNVPAPQRMDGRVLSEALRNGGLAPQVKSGQWQDTGAAGTQKRRQYLKWSQVGETIYLDEGNAETLP